MSPVADAADSSARLIDIARATVAELRQQDAGALRPTLDSTLERDLGLDSLARVELFARIEHEFDVRLPESVFESAENLRDIATALERLPSAREISGVHLEERKVEIAGNAPPRSIGTLTQVLRWHADRDADFGQITICEDKREEVLTYDSLLRDARFVAGGLQHARVEPGEAVALMLPTSREYFCSFFGILLAGAVPVPLYPPTRISQIEEHVRRHAGILANAGAVALITTPTMRRLAGLLRMHAPCLKMIMTTEELYSSNLDPRAVNARADSVALLQYTSGSTGQPKGVMLTHANLLSNITALGSALEVSRDDVFVSWLPLYHDMGLIGAWLGTLYFGIPLIVMSPLAFLSRPVRWLESIHRHRGTLSAAPNFAYELCLKRATDEELAGLSLSSWRLAMNGSEAVMPDTLRRFHDRFACYGLRRDALTPVYGLAECSVGLTVPPLRRGPLIDVIERDALVQHGIAKPAGSRASNTLSFVSCGRAIARHEVRIVNDAGLPLTERQEGRLEFRGPSATQGYYRNMEATSKLIHSGWLDSGDRAYIANGEIYVTGRIKDIIIRAGRHLHPDEVEAHVGAIPGVRKGCVAVFGSTGAASGTERVVVLVETRLEEMNAREHLRNAIVAAVVELIGEPPDEVVLAAPHTVLKTSSGKIRRAATRDLYESRSHPIARAPWLQMLRLTLGAVRPASRRRLQQALDLLYAMYFWTWFAVLGGTTFLIALLPLSRQAIWSIGHRSARVFLRVARVPLTIDGAAPTAAAGVIVVANHSSYLDGLYLLAALPKAYRFVVKRELARMPFVGLFLKRLGSVFVERFEVRAGVKDAHRIADLVARGDSCIFFPEGTFARGPGLLPFHLGAFAAAVEAARPIVPIALRGARAVLRDDEWLPRRRAVGVHIGAPLEASAGRNSFTATIALRDAARGYLLAHCGEPNMARSHAADFIGS